MGTNTLYDQNAEFKARGIYGSGIQNRWAKKR
jgi:hypothetical protein